MKKIQNVCKLMLASLFVAAVAVSCSGDNKGTPSTPGGDPSVLPEFKGAIKFEPATRIGEGQKVTASYLIPTGGTNVKQERIYWESETTAIEGTTKDGTSYVNFIAAAAGENQISFVGQYMNIEKAESQKKSIAGKYTSVKCDVVTSFWNDSKDVVMATANEEKLEDNSGVLKGVEGKSWINKDFKAIRYYHFAENKLSQLTEGMTIAVNATANLLKLTNTYTVGGESKGFILKSFDVVDISTGAKEAVDRTKFEDKTYCDPINNAVREGTKELLSVLQSDKTVIIISYKLSTQLAKVMCEVTYTPRVANPPKVALQ